MARLTNRAYTARAPQTAQQWPEMPDLDPQISALDGGRTNAALQRWSDLCAQRVAGNEEQDNGRFRNIQKSITRGNDYLESVWTMQAVAGPVVTGMELFSSIDRTSHTIVSRITFQADVFQIQTASGNHKEIFSTSADAIKLGDVLTVDLANARVYIGTGTYGNSNTAFYVDDDGYFSLKNKLTFDPTGTGTLTVTGTIIAGAGEIGGFSIGTDYLRDAGNSFGLASTVTGGDDVRFWAGAAFASRSTAPFRVTEGGVVTAVSGTIGGWTLSTTTLTASNVVINSAGTIALGTLNDILIVSAADATYRMWAGNATAGSASFSVTKTGVLYATGATISGSITATSGTIGGFTIGASSLTGGTGIETLAIYSNGGGISLGNTSGTRAIIYADVPNSLVGFSVFSSTNTLVGDFYVDTTFGVNAGAIDLYNSAGTATVQFNAAGTGAISTGLYIGSGASLTNLNASNLSSGTVGTARLGSGSASSSTFLRGDQTWAGITAGDVSGLAASATTDATNASNISSGTLSNSRLSFSKTGTGDVPIDGYVSVGGVKLATVA